MPEAFAQAGAATTLTGHGRTRKAPGLLSETHRAGRTSTRRRGAREKSKKEAMAWGDSDLRHGNTRWSSTRYVSRRCSAPGGGKRHAKNRSAARRILSRLLERRRRKNKKKEKEGKNPKGHGLLIAKSTATSLFFRTADPRVLYAERRGRLYFYFSSSTGLIFLIF